VSASGKAYGLPTPAICSIVHAMDHLLKDHKPPTKSSKTLPTVSTILADARIVELVRSSSSGKTALVVWNGTRWDLKSSIRIGSSTELVPYSASNNLIKNEVVLLASQPEEYGSQRDLTREIETFIHRYVDVSPLFEKIASYYVLLSWVYDGFNELPYLRLRGDPGSGKTRFLLTVGALCYKPIFASGASTVSPLFRILDAFRGTLIIDEGDFRMSDERAEIVKILNNGNAKGFPVLRTEVSTKKEFNPTAYNVYGPKLVATRGLFEDRALESRCLTEPMAHYRLRNDIPINLPVTAKDEAQQLRNKLLLFRFRTLMKVQTDERFVDRSIEPRLNQVFVPLLSIIDDPDAREDVRELARRYNAEMISDRGMDTEAQLLEVIREVLASGEPSPSINAITSWFMDRHGENFDRKITPKWVGGIIRKKLNLKTQKSHGVFVIPPSEHPKLTGLYERFGITSKENQKDAPTDDTGTLGTLGIS
jgi:hypothetical protein